MNLIEGPPKRPSYLLRKGAKNLAAVSYPANDPLMLFRHYGIFAISDQEARPDTFPGVGLSDLMIIGEGFGLTHDFKGPLSHPPGILEHKTGGSPAPKNPIRVWLHAVHTPILIP